jgi:hypothetical protein
VLLENSNAATRRSSHSAGECFWNNFELEVLITLPITPVSELRLKDGEFAAYPIRHAASAAWSFVRN